MNTHDSSNSNRDAQPDYLVQYRSWLRIMAQLQLDDRWERKFDASDIVQQTLMEAWNGESGFAGTTDGQRIAWLRTILGRVISRQVRHFDGVLKRDPARELALQNSLNQSSMMLAGLFAGNDPTPSVQADDREQQTIIADVLETLPDDYRQVILLRNLRGMNHAEIGQVMDRSESAVRMLWLRALKQLREEVLSRQ